MAELELYDDSEAEYESIAIIGMAARYPGARNAEAFWQNLRQGVESVRFFSAEELIAAGEAPERVHAPTYVRASPVLDDIEQFDADFFAIPPSEAELLDPQHRFFLESAWEALEDAGYDPGRYAGLIGVYSGVSPNNYLLRNLWSNGSLLESLGVLPVVIANDRDYMPTRVSYKLNLRGPSLNVQTACSTSLVATHLACQSLLNHQCDIALAGGVTIQVPPIAGYEYQEGGVASPDGHCRPFDAQAQGTLFGSGVGIVVLKRLSEAVEDGDHIYAVIKGSAINNDGSLKVGYTAPGLEGQAAVIAMAQGAAGVEPETIDYIETHGTGTVLGDPIEFQALTQAFRAQSARKQFCALGSVKSNIGHTDSAAGTAGLIKTALALTHKELPPSLNFERPNPNLDLDNSPFFINTTLRPWPAAPDRPRRAGVSSFGIGGTNAHLILEEAPPLPPAAPARPWQLLTLSARSPAALDAATAALRDHLIRHPEQPLPDVAYTLQVGRRAFPHRRILACQDHDEAASLLAGPAPKRLFSGQANRPPPVVLMFPGGGAQYVGMGANLFQNEPLFREQMTLCAHLLQPHLGSDLLASLYPPDPENAPPLVRTSLALPALFAVEYALARLLLAWGIRPQALIGHSMGEYVAACLAGVFSLDDALALVALRGRLFDQLPQGSMLSLPLAEAEARALLGPDLDIAAINGPTQCVVSGPREALAALAAQLTAQGIEFRPLHIDVAAHSSMVEPILETFTRFVSRLRLHPPTIPFLSNVTGSWITDREATDPTYWAHHLRHTVRFSDGIATLLAEPGRVLLEVGPGRTLHSLAQLQPASANAQAILATMRHPQDTQPDQAFLLTTLGRLWVAGVEVDWTAFHAAPRRRVPLPTYPFERKRFWIEPESLARPTASRALHKRPNLAEWGYLPGWRSARLPHPFQPPAPGEQWLLFTDETGLGAALADQLREAGQALTLVTRGEQFERVEGGYRLPPDQRVAYDALLDALPEPPTRILHLWSLVAAEAPLELCHRQGFASLLFLAQALDEHARPTQIEVITHHLLDLTGDAKPEQAPLRALCQVIPQELVGLGCRCIEIVLPTAPAPQAALAARLLAETQEPTLPLVAYRHHQRWLPYIEPLPLVDAVPPLRHVRPQGVYLLVGGGTPLGGMLAEILARTAQARLLLVGETIPAALADSLTALGSEVEIVVGEPDEATLRTALQAAESRWGALHGVFYTADLSLDEAFHFLREAGAEAWLPPIARKAKALEALARVLSEHPPEFCLLNSTLSTVLGGPGLAALAAADHLVDAFARRQSRLSPFPWLVINWDVWQEEEERAHKLAPLSLTPSEGGEVLRRILAAATTEQILISTGDLALRLIQGQPRQHHEEGSLSLHERPASLGGVIAPQSEVEIEIGRIWQGILGIREIGIHDDFFELGGNSLLLTQLLNQLQAAFGLELPIRDLFEQSTVAALATLITLRQGEAAARADEPLPARLRALFPHERLPMLLAWVQQAGGEPSSAQAARLTEALALPVTSEEVAALSPEALARTLLVRLNLAPAEEPATPAAPSDINVAALSDEDVLAMLSQMLEEDAAD